MTPAAPLPTPAPRASLETEEFWKATGDGRLLLKRCDSCATVIWYPRAFCPACSSTSTSWFEASGQGTVYSYTIVHKARGDWVGSTPYVAAYVELEEGPRVMTNVVDCDPTDVSVGMAVELVWHDTGAGTALYRFRPAG